MIIHISGSSGSGKTTIGNKIKKMFNNKVAVFDVDDLHMNPLTRPEYIFLYYFV
jgi:uridine kinase